MPLTPGTRLGPYEVTAQIGAGGMGEVYAATDTNLGRKVAIKVLPESMAAAPDRLARFSREAKTLAALNHPHIAAIYGLERAGERTAIVMELVEGPTLADRIAEGALPLDEALPIAKQIAEALEAAHEQGIIHRDLKPANIKVRPDGMVKVLDFGLAKAMESVPSTSPAVLSQAPTTTTPAMTQIGMILGSAAYMSPEQARGKPVDRRADIWAFGAVLYEILTGTRAFPGDTITETLASVLKVEPDWQALPQPALQRLASRCLTKDVRQRLQAIGEARVALDDALHASSTTSLESLPVRSTTGSMWKLGWIAATLALASAAAAAAWVIRGTSREPAAVIQLSLVPAGGYLLTPDSVPVLSPDGRHVAFVATRNDKRMNQQRTIWVRDLDSSVARSLGSTEGASYLFWSPDSRSIGFFSGTVGELRKIDLAGGPSTVLARTRGGSGSWGRDVIIFSTSPTSSELFSIGTGGGAISPLTTLDRASGELGHAYPAFLPDGRHFLYTVLDGSGDGKIYLGEMGTTARRLVVPSGVNASYAAPGFIVYHRARSLLAQAFNVDAGAVTSNPMPITDQLEFVSSRPQAKYSVSQTGVLAFMSGPSDGNVTLTWFDRSGSALATVGAAMNGTQFPRLSPDETQILYDRQDMQTGTFRIWLHDTTRNTDSPVTSPSEGSRFPFWLDRSHAGFSMQSPVAIGVRDLARGGPSTVLAQGRAGSGIRPLGVSPDGRFLLSERTDPTTRADIWIYPLSDNATAGDPHPYLSEAASEQYPAISPNGLWCAYVFDESGQREIYVQSFPTAGRKVRVSIDGGDFPVWSRDGRELYFLSLDGRMMTAAVEKGETFTASQPRLLFDPHGVSNGWFDVDGKGRFLIPVQTRESETAPVTVIVNWQSALAAKSN